MVSGGGSSEIGADRCCCEHFHDYGEDSPDLEESRLWAPSAYECLNGEIVGGGDVDQGSACVGETELNRACSWTIVGPGIKTSLHEVTASATPSRAV